MVHLPQPYELHEGLCPPGLRLPAAVASCLHHIYCSRFLYRTMNDSTGTFIWLILGSVLVASVRHIAEAIRKRDPEAIGEGLGTMLFSAIGIILKAFG